MITVQQDNSFVLPAKMNIENLPSIHDSFADVEYTITFLRNIIQVSYSTGEIVQFEYKFSRFIGKENL